MASTQTGARTGGKPRTQYNKASRRKGPPKKGSDEWFASQKKLGLAQAGVAKRGDSTAIMRAGLSNNLWYAQIFAPSTNPSRTLRRGSAAQRGWLSGRLAVPAQTPFFLRSGYGSRSGAACPRAAARAGSA